MTAPRRVDGAARFAVEKLDVFHAAVDLLVVLDRLWPGLWRRNSSLCRQL